MKKVLSVASISLLAWLAIAPFQAVQAQVNPNGTGTTLDNSPNRAESDNLGDDPGVDDYEVQGTGENDTQIDNRDSNVRPNVDANRSENGTTLDNSPNRVYTDNEGDDPGVDDYEVQGTGENNIQSPSVDRPQYNRPVTGQSTPQQPNYNTPGSQTSPNYNNPGTQQTSPNYNNPNSSQSPNNSDYNSQPVRGLW